MTVQSPIAIDVNNRIQRCRVNKTAIIINESRTATVWCSGNPGMSPGQGTVINPGTFVNWTQPGDVYLILGTDVRSTDVGVAHCTVSYDVNQWSPDPVAIAASALSRQQLIATFTPTAPTVIQTVIDGSLFSSLLVSVQPPLSGNNIYSFYIYFFQTLADATNFVNPYWQQQWRWYNPSINGNAVPLRVSVPIEAPYIKMQVAGGAAGAWIIKSTLNTVPANHIKYELSANNFTPPGVNGALVDVSGGVIAPAGNVNILSSVPYLGEVEITAEMDYGAAIAAGALAGGVDVFSQNTVAAGMRYGIQVLVGDAFSAIFGAVSTRYRQAWDSEQKLVRLSNLAAGATTAYNLRVVAVNPYG
jgi:hypothetical protein